jgi:hypothetical protein
MGLQKVGCGGVDWIDLAQDRERWRALVTAVMNHRISCDGGISRLAKNLLASKEGLCSIN